MTFYEEITTLILNTIATYSSAILIILGSVILLITGLLVFKWGWIKLQEVTLGYMHTHTDTFKRLGPRGQAAWSSIDRNWSRAQIMRNDI